MQSRGVPQERGSAHNFAGGGMPPNRDAESD